MPNWTPYIQDALARAVRWLTIDNISRDCQLSFARAREVRTGRPVRQNPKPSAPCVKNCLIESIQGREVVAMKGARGANWFAHFLNAGTDAFRHGPGLPRDHQQREEAINWNNHVRAAMREGGALPIPWANISRSRSRSQRTPVREAPSGPLIEEAVRVIENFCRRNEEFNPEVRDFLSRMGIINNVDGGSLAAAQAISRDLRPHISMGDLEEAMRELLEKVQDKARVRAETGPRTLEDEFFSRLRSFADEDDG